MTPAAQAQALFQAYLPRLGAALARAEAALPPAAWRARLAPDMLPLLVQAEVTVNLALRTHAALGGTEVAWGPTADSPAGVQHRVAHALTLWRQVPEPVVAVCHDRAGEAEHQAAPQDFVLLYALPNYLFHHAQVHALLRQLGLPLGKADFDGVHTYAPRPTPDSARALAPGLVVRRLTPADAAAFQGLRLTALRAHPEAFGASPDSPTENDPAQALKRLQPRPGHAQWGLWRGATLLGLAALGREEAPKLAHKAWLWGVYVHPTARRHGGGEALVRAALAEARAWGLARVLLGVHADNTPAVSLYQRLGFVAYGLEHDFLRVDGVPQTEWQMGCTP